MKTGAVILGDAARVSAHLPPWPQAPGFALDVREDGDAVSVKLSLPAPPHERLRGRNADDAMAKLLQPMDVVPG